MKTFIFALGIVAFMGVAVSLIPNEYAVEGNIIKEEEIVEEEVYPEAWLREAEEAKNAVLRRKELEKELSDLKETKGTLESQIEAIEKELGTY